MLSKRFAGWILSVLFIQLSANAGCESIDGKNIIERDKKSFIISFVLLNYSRILNDLQVGDGIYLESLINELKNQKVPDIKEKAGQASSAYDFAKKLTE